MRLAIVTGGSKGLGNALCLQLASAGYQVLEFSRSAPHRFSSRVDLAVPAEVPRAVVAALAAIEPRACTELLVFNNAGTLAPIGPAWQKASEHLLANLNANFSSAVLVLAAVMQHFRETPCRKLIVNVSSGAALKGYAGWSLYCASKAGMEGFIRAIAAEEQFQQHPFIAVSVNPGVIDTDMQAAIRAMSTADFPEVERFKRRKLEGGLATAESVAAAIIRLLSNRQLEPGERYDAPTEA
jgi:benzil reductase ((S)-benzoin forming)